MVDDSLGKMFPLTLFYDDRALARSINRKERLDERFKPENMSEKQVLAMLDTIVVDVLFSDVDVKWYKKALGEAGADNVEETLRPFPHYPPQSKLFFSGHVDFRKLEQLIYH